MEPIASNKLESGSDVEQTTPDTSRRSDSRDERPSPCPRPSYGAVLPHRTKSSVKREFTIKVEADKLSFGLSPGPNKFYSSRSLRNAKELNRGEQRRLGRQVDRLDRQLHRRKVRLETEKNEVLDECVKKYPKVHSQTVKVKLMIQGQGDMMVRKLGNTRYKDIYEDFSVKDKLQEDTAQKIPKPKRKMDLDPNAVDAVAKANVISSPRRSKTDFHVNRRRKETRRGTEFHLEGQRCLGGETDRGNSRERDSLPKLSPVSGVSPSKLVDNKFGYVKSHVYQLETLKKKRVNLPELEREISQSAEKHLYACQLPHHRGSKRSDGVRSLAQTFSPDVTSSDGSAGQSKYSEQTNSGHVSKVNLVHIQKVNKKAHSLPPLDSPENIYLDVTLPKETRVTGT